MYNAATRTYSYNPEYRITTLTQTGNGIVYDLMLKGKTFEKQPLVVYDPNATALSTVNYFDTQSFFNSAMGPQLERQLKGMGITDVDKKYLVPRIDGTVVVGKEVDKALNNNLGYTFKTFDNFDNTTGTATSVKSVNLNAPSYQDDYKNPNQLSNTLNGYINATLNFENYTLKGKYLNLSMIKTRELHIVVDNQPLTLQQQANLQRTLNFARLNNIGVRVTINMGTGGK